MKRGIAFFVALAVLACGALAVAAPESIELPVTEEPITLKIMGAQSPFHVDWNEMASWIELEERTGIDIEFEMVPKSMMVEKRNLKLASGDLPDAFIGCQFTASDLVSHGADGLIVPLEDYIDGYMPNFSAVINDPAYQSVRAGITFPDGHIYAMPHLYQADYWAMVGQEHFFINTEWLERLGLAMPTTTDEFMAVLKAFKEQDADGDGDPGNEVPLGGKSNVITRLITSLNGSWGLQNMGFSHTYIDRDPSGDGGDLRFFKTDGRYREVLQFMRDLYQNGYIEQEAFTMETAQIITRASTGAYGVLNCLSPMGDYAQEYGLYQGMDILTGPYGDQTHAAVNSNIARNGDFVMTSANRHPVETMKMYDYFCYSPEGLILLYLGQEGLQWEYDENGVPQYMDHITHNPDGLTMDQAIGQFTFWPDGSVSSFSEKTTSRSIRTLPDAYESCEMIHDKYVTALPPLTFTLEEADRLLRLQDMITYVDSMTQKFIKGDESLDNWDRYVETVRNMGLDDYMAIQQAAYDRLLANMQ